MPKTKHTNPDTLIEGLDLRYAKTRRLLFGVIYELDEIMKRRGDNRANARYEFIASMGRIYDNMIDELGACNDTELRERDERIEKMSSNIMKLLAKERALTKALAAAREGPKSAQKGPEKCPETASTPKST